MVRRKEGKTNADQLTDFPKHHDLAKELTPDGTFVSMPGIGTLNEIGGGGSGFVVS